MKILLTALQWEEKYLNNASCWPPYRFILWPPHKLTFMGLPYKVYAGHHIMLNGDIK